MRGYDRRQVDEMLARLDEDLRVRRGRTRLGSRAQRRSRRPAGQRTGPDRVPAPSAASGDDEVDEFNVDPAVRQILDAAQADALRAREEADAYVAQTRRAAEQDAERTRAAARAEADQITDAATRRHVEADDEFRRRIAEADRYRVEVVERAALDVAAARQEEELLTARAEDERNRLAAVAAAERERLDTEARQKIMTGLEDFEIMLRERRTAETKQSSDERAAAVAEANRIVTEAKNAAAQTIAEATARVTELNAHRDRTHDDLTALHGRLAAVIATTAPQTATEAATEAAAEAASQPDAESGADGG